MRISNPLAAILCVLLPFLSSCRMQKEFVYLENSPVKITELHYNPSAEQGKVEFIEITNITTKPLDLSGWQVTGAGRVALPAGTELAARKAVVLCRDPDAFEKEFGRRVKPAATLPGKLSNKGEIVRIENPQGQVGDEVSYDKADPEVEKAAGTGLSIRRVGLTAAAVEWRAAKPSPGPWKSTR